MSALTDRLLCSLQTLMTVEGQYSINLQPERQAMADAASTLLNRPDLVRALMIARWYVQDHHEAQPNEETAGHLRVIDKALEGAE